MAVPKRRSSKKRQGDRVSVYKLDNAKNAQNKKLSVKITQNADGKISIESSSGHKTNSNGEYKGIKIVKDKKPKIKAEEN
jgi:ribosomal protein L32